MLIAQRAQTACLLVCCLIFGVAEASGQVMKRRLSDLDVVESAPRTIIETKNSYVFESDLDGFGKQDAWQTEVEASRRFLLHGNFYLRLGGAYQRFDFGETSAPVPDHLQSFAGTISIEYMRGKHVGAFFSMKPGFYTEDHLNGDSFDIPMTLGSAFVLQKDKLYLFAGVTASFLRGNLPVLPLLGVVWLPCDQLRVMGLIPDPRIVYSPTKTLDLWIGGELNGGSFRTDQDEDIRPLKLSGTQVDYSDYRAGLGLTYCPNEALTIDVAAGYSFERSFDYNRAGEEYSADPAPYFRLLLKAKF